MTAASLLTQCNTCNFECCPGLENCPDIMTEKITFSPTIKPAIHAQKYTLKIPNDISPILKKANATIPRDGKILIRWDKISKRIKISILDNSKEKKERETVLYAAGNKDFLKRTLHFRGNVLIKIQD